MRDLLDWLSEVGLPDFVGMFVLFGLIALAIAWLLIPFAVFGIKKRMDEQTQLLKQITLSLQKEKGR